MGESSFLKFVLDMRGMIDLSMAEPDRSIDECTLCCDVYQLKGEKRPRFLSCCKQNMCASCEKKVNKAAEEKRVDDPAYDAQCPFCRKHLPMMEDDEKCLEKIKDVRNMEDTNKTVEPEGIKCAICATIARKPHHRFVCLTCRDDIGAWLMSGKEEDRVKIKEGTYCIPCSYRHSLYHERRRQEKNALRPLSQVFGYTRGQVEKASSTLVKKIETDGYMPHSICIVYSLFNDVMKGGMFETSTINLLIKTKKTVVEKMKGMKDDCELKIVAVRDFCIYFQRMTSDLEKWSNEIMKEKEDHSSELGERILAVSQLLFTSSEWMVAMQNDKAVIEECWDYLAELILELIPSIVRRREVLDKWRILTIVRLFKTCAHFDAAWDEQAYGKLLKREMVCIRQSKGYPSDALSILYSQYEKMCEDHELEYPDQADENVTDRRHP